MLRALIAPSGIKPVCADKIIGGDKLESALASIAKKLGSAKQIKIGFMSGATYPDGTPVAMVAAIQNYGAPRAGIPPRPFFSNMVADKSPQWGDRLVRILKGANNDGKLALERMGASIGSDLQQSILDGGWEPNKPSTHKAKGFQNNTPLIDTAHMINSVQYDVDGEMHNLPGVSV